MDFYRSEIFPFKQEIDLFFEHDVFSQFIQKYQSNYFTTHYFDVFKQHCKGGKCIRGYLVKLGYEIAANRQNDNILYPAVAYEVFETSILAHDDIIDRSPIRRRIPSMHVALGDKHKGISRSICVGDAGMLLANALLLEAGYPAEICIKALIHQTKIFSYTLSGELSDIDLSHTHAYSENQVLNMYILKTSLYTVAGPLILGAILGDATEETIKALYDYGCSLGIAFQIVDDILGIFGDEELTGKPITSDAAEGKKSILTAYFDKSVNGEEKEKFYKVYGHEMIDDKAMDAIREALISSGAYHYAKEKAKAFNQQALQSIENSSISHNHKKVLYDLCSYMIERKM